MDPVSLLASVEAIAEGAFQIISYINTVKEGGKQRMRILTELNSLWMVLKLVEAHFETEDEELDQTWIKAIAVLSEDSGLFDQIGEILESLNKKLQPKMGFRKAIQSVRWPFDKPEVDTLVSQLDRLKNGINLALTSTSALAIREIHTDTKSLRSVAAVAETKAYLAWISSLNFLKQQSEFIRQARQGTGEWFLKRKDFQKWKDAETGMLWCPGIPGAGKTFLASIIFDHLQEISQGQNHAVLIAYCGYNETKSQSIDNLVAAIVKQVIQIQPDKAESPTKHSVGISLAEMYRSHSKKETFPSLPELRKLLHEELKKFEKCYIIIDALDEIADEPKRLELLDLLSAERLNVLITSRRLDNIADLFSTDVLCDGCEDGNARVHYHCRQCGGYGFDLCESCFEQGFTCAEEGHYTIKRFVAATISIEATRSDIRNYVQWRIDHEARLLDCVTKKQVLREQIAVTLVQQSNGMFLLAKLHMDALSTKRTPKAVQATLRTLPTEIAGTYEQAMSRIEATNEDDRRLAMNLLRWIVFAARALTVEELEHATSVVPNSHEIDSDEIVSASDLTSLCAGLVVIDASNILRLVHFSAQSYLQDNRTKWFSDGDFDIAQTCLTYLTFKEFEMGPCSGQNERRDFVARSNDYPLLDYACTYWGIHVSRSKDATALTKQALHLLQSKTLRQSSVQALWYSDNPTLAGWDAKEQVEAIHLASYCGLADVVTALIRDGSVIDCKDSMGTTPLMYAVNGGSLSVVRLLLRHEADPNMICDRGSSALHRAIAANEMKIAKVLLEQPMIDLEITDASRGEKTPLMLTVTYGSPELLELILKKPNVDVNRHTGSYKTTLLTLAAATGDAQVVRQILCHSKIDVNKRNKWCSALTEAATQGFFSVVEALLDHDADPEIQEGPNHSSGTALNRAIDHGHNAIVRLLLQRGANAKVVDVYNRTIVHSAAVNGRTETLKILYEANCGVDINAQGSNGRTALHDAAYFDYCSTIEILFKNGARTDILDNDHRSPLGVAKDQGQLAALELLTKLRKQEEARDKAEGRVLSHPRSIPTNDIRAAFLSAAKSGHTDIVKSTLAYLKTDSTIDINTVDLDRHSALHYAVQGGNIAILQALIAAEGIDLNIQDRLERTPLHWTAIYGRQKAATILLDTGRVDLTIRDHFEETALTTAMERGRSKLAVLLMENGAWPPKHHMQDALCYAAFKGGSVQLCEKLVRDGGADPSRKNSDGEAPYHLAEYAGNKEAAAALLRLCE